MRQRWCLARRLPQATTLHAASHLAALLRGLLEPARIWALMLGPSLLALLCGMLALPWVLAKRGGLVYNLWLLKCSTPVIPVQYCIGWSRLGCQLGMLAKDSVWLSVLLHSF